ncbi:hypothetical protein NLU13_7836 [Sarocladium strictum]|uniref:Mid2 domain-containing protein n=1 Tax=Sarocladium strictum TaxID=5046 RepID=A0AA39GDI7_SARSR|nr:hypothetical protein NLU13_7836 [Sarocladium strictum]
MSTGISLPFFLLLLLTAIPVVLAQCYYPNGAEAKDDKPCDENAENSMCCTASTGSLCLSNKLCSGPNGNVIRGSCTDKDWDAPECASYCLGESRGGTDLISCFNSTSSDISYCCDHTTDCCDTGVGRFIVLPSDPEIWARYNSKEKKYSVVGTMYSASTSTTMPSTSTTAEATTIQSDKPSESSDTSQNSERNRSADGLSTGAMAGIGAGVGFSILITVAIAFFTWKRCRRRRRQSTHGTRPRGKAASRRPRRGRHEAMEKFHHGGAQELPGTIAPRHFHSYIHELPASLRFESTPQYRSVQQQSTP